MNIVQGIKYGIFDVLSVLKKQLIGYLEVIYQFDKNVDAIADKIISELELDEQKSLEIKDKNKWTHDDVIFINR